ncbi:small GTPase-binding protein [Flagelloscypha sp. PMI_526]|nr:small GTPase-binding protein [Flagelloscypha sp. PMI_526]
MPVYRCKLVIVGDGAVGKTCLITRFVKGVFPMDYVPTVFENYVVDIQVDQQNMEMALWDTAGHDCDFGDRLRPLSYIDSHVALLAYSIDYPDSLDNILEKWHPELDHFIPRVPTILIACKKDLRDDEKTVKDLARSHQRPVTFDEGLAVALKIGAGQFFECSSKTGEGVAEIFEVAARAAMEHRTLNRRKDGNSCVIC